MANQITRDIYVLRKSIIEPIHYVRLTNAVDIVFNMRDYDIPSGAVAAVYAQKPDGTAVYSNATISENTVTVEMTTQMVAVLGVGHLQVRIQSGSNSANVLCSFVVPLIVEPNFTEGDFPPSKNENGFFGDVEEHLQQVESDMTTMKEEWTEFQNDITQQVQEIQEEQTTQGREITDLQKKVAKLDEEKSPALVLDASGSWVTVDDSGDSAANGLTIHGKSTQVETTGAQLFDAESVTWFANNSSAKDIEKTDTGVKFTTVKHVNGGNGVYTFVQDIDLTKVYTISMDITVNNKNFSSIYVGFNGIVNQVNISASSITVNVPYHVVVQKGLQDKNIVVYLNNEGQTEDVTVTAENIIVSESYTVVPWEPYTGGAPSPSPDYPQEITSAGDGGSIEVVSMGKNLLPFGEGDLEIGQPLVKAGRTYVLNSDGSVSITTQDASSSTGNVFIFGSVYDKKYYKLPPGVYRFSTNSNVNISIQLTDYEGNNTRVAGGSNSYFNLREGECIAYAWLYGDSGTEWNETIYPQLEMGNVATPYEPYRSSTATFSTPNGLPGIPVNTGGNYTDADGQQWICDEINTKTGAYIKRVGKITFDGSSDERWSNYPNIKYLGFLIDIDDMTPLNHNPGMCDRFVVDMSVQASYDRPGVWLGSTSASNVSTKTHFHNCNPSIASSVEEWRTWLSTHPVTLIYPLATPVETPLSDVELIEAGNLRTFATTTNVTTEDPVEPEITLEYAADLKTYIDKKLAEISAATLENATNASQ